MTLTGGYIKCQIQYERPYCIGYTMSSRRRDILYPIQYGREYCIVLMKWKARFYLPPEGNSHILVSGTIEARILYCTYEMKSTLLFAPRREFAHFSIRYNRGANIVLCLWNEKHAYICPPKGISSGWTDHGILNSFASDCQHGRITFSKAEKCRRRSSLVARDYSPKYKK